MKIFHGWRMVAAAGAIQFLQAGMLHQAFGAYFAVLNEERGWSKTALSGAAALQSTEAALIGPLLGWIIDRFGPQGVIRVGIVALGVGFMLLSAIETLAGLYGAILVIALGASASGFFPLNVAIVHWFERQRARALSLVGLGLAIGGVLVPLVAASMQAFGWRATAFASGAIFILTGLPLSRVFKRRPEDVGETVDGVAPVVPAAQPPSGDAHETGATALGPQQGLTLRQALRTRAFWLLGLGHSAALLVVTAVNVHAITHMRQGLGFSVAQASLYITLMTVSQVAGVLIGSVIGDRYDKRRVAAVCMFGHASGMLALTYATGAPMLVAFAVLHGVAWGLRGPFMQALRADFFGRRAIGMIMGMSALLTALGQIAGPIVAGVFADATGDYRTGFTLLAIVAASGSIMFLAARRPA